MIAANRPAVVVHSGRGHQLPIQPAPVLEAEFFHGGVPGLEVGDVIRKPGQRGSVGVYMTHERRLARNFAVYRSYSGFDRAPGDLYIVEPIGEVRVHGRNEHVAHSATVVAVAERGCRGVPRTGGGAHPVDEFGCAYEPRVREIPARFAGAGAPRVQ